ncbi:hypothetical protein FA15DRAFT_578493, partial [Coprinopsis marcescibilis]
MARVERDPTGDVCPAFEQPEFQAVRDSMKPNPPGEPRSEEEVLRMLRDSWKAGHDKRVEDWNMQVQRDREERERLEREQEQQDEEQAERPEGEGQKIEEDNGKKTKKVYFDENIAIGDTITDRPASYALNKLKLIEYIELFYFTPDGC